MTRSEIINAAKFVVLGHGANIVLEFAEDLVDRNLDAQSPADRAAVARESVKQARRVIKFLGL